MKCPHCGTENRPDVRFCRACGRPLNADAPATPSEESQPPPASAAPSGRSCPHCGSAVKPQARFCPRCGEALPPAPPASTISPAEQPTPSAPPAQPSSPAPTPPSAQAQPPQEQPRYTQPQQQPPSGKTQPQPQGGAQQEAYTRPQASAPPPAAPPSTPSTGAQSGLPTWLWIAVGVFVGILFLGIAFLGFRLLSRDDEPNPTATPTPTATQEVAAPTDTPEPVAAVPTATPTLSPTQTPAPPQEEEEGHQVGDITLGQPPAELRIGDSWTLTATVENTGDIGFEMVDYDLLGNWEAILELPQPPRIDPTPLQPQETRTVEFVFRAIQEGQAEIRLLVTVLVNEIPPSKELIEAEPIQVTIVP